MKPDFDFACPASDASSLRNRLQSIGVSVNETNRLIATAKATVRPKLEKNRPTMPPMKAIGRKMTISERLVARTARAISFVPTRAAVMASMPSSSMCRKMFSWTTTASSMTMPMARISPSIVMLFRVNPIAFMNRNVGMIEVGMARVAIRVVRQSRMNSKIVSETSPAASRRWNFTSSIEFLMNRDWSRMTSVEMSGGRAALRSSSRALMSSTTATVFVPDCFWTLRLTALAPSSRARVRGSSIESSARPTSRTRTG